MQFQNFIHGLKENEKSQNYKTSEELKIKHLGFKSFEFELNRNLNDR